MNWSTIPSLRNAPYLSSIELNLASRWTAPYRSFIKLPDDGPARENFLRRGKCDGVQLRASHIDRPAFRVRAFILPGSVIAVNNAMGLAEPVPILARPPGECGASLERYFDFATRSIRWECQLDGTAELIRDQIADETAAITASHRGLGRRAAKLVPYHRQDHRSVGAGALPAHRHAAVRAR